MNDLRQRHHPDCVVCGANHPSGLKLSFSLDDRGVAISDFDCDARFQGYPGLLHGGVISSLLDGAMTNCLFLHGKVAVTAELVVRFRHPVAVSKPAFIRAWIDESSSPVFRLKAELIQDNVIRATARAAFMLPQPATLPGKAPVI